MGHRILYVPKPVNPIFYPEYGALYNWYVVNDERNIANVGWHVATPNEYSTIVRDLYDYYGLGTAPENTLPLYGSQYLKKLGIEYWINASTGNNNLGFNATGTGYRYESGNFLAIQQINSIWTNTTLSTSSAKQVSIYGSDQIRLSMNYIGFGANMHRGCAIRTVKDSTTLSHGETGVYIGNDGKVYRTICINTQEWLADNLAETRFRNGDIIPWHGANPANFFTNAEWAALTTAGMCAYNNDVNNVAAGFTFPT